MAATALVLDPRCLLHVTGPAMKECERPARLWEVHRALAAAGLLERVALLPCAPATRAQLLAVHGEDYLERLAASYSQFFYRYEAAPVLIVNSDNLNFADEPADFELLLRCIADMRGPREFISRGGA